MVAERTKTEPAEGEEVEEWPVTSLEADMMAGALDDALRDRVRERRAHLALGPLVAVDVRRVDHPVAGVQRRQHGLLGMAGSQLVGTESKPRHQHGCR